MNIVKKMTDWSEQSIKDKYVNNYGYILHEILLAIQEVGVSVDISTTMSGSKIDRVSASVSFGGAPAAMINNTKVASYLYFYDVNGSGFTLGSVLGNANSFSLYTSSSAYITVIGGSTSCAVFISSTPVSIQSDFVLMISKTTVDNVTETTINGLHSKVNSLTAPAPSGVLRVTYDAPTRLQALTSSNKILIKCIDALGITSTSVTAINLNDYLISEYYGTVVNDVHWVLCPPKGTPVNQYSLINIDGVGYIVRGTVYTNSYYVWKVG